jgi:hypothetical protein
LALRCLGFGALFLLANLGKLLAPNPSYYPWLFLFGVPGVLIGIVGLVFPGSLVLTESKASSTGGTSITTSANPLGTMLVFVVGLVGVGIGGYLVYKPQALLDWLGL